MMNFLAPCLSCLSSVLDAEHTQKTSLGGWVVPTLALLSELKVLKKKRKTKEKYCGGTIKEDKTQ